MVRRHMLRWLYSAILVGYATAATAGAAQPSAGCGANTFDKGWKLERKVDVDGRERSYILDVPTSLAPATPVPLLLDFHGFGHSAAGVWGVSRFREIAERDPFIAVYPDGIQVRFTHRGRDYDGPGWDIRTRDGNRD